MLLNESSFKLYFKKKLKKEFKGCFLYEMKAGAQGIPDTLMIFGKRWALLEFKRSKNASKRPNQEYYIRLFNAMGFASFVTPENQDEVIEKLRLYFEQERKLMLLVLRQQKDGVLLMAT